MTSAERVLQYISMPPEAALESDPQHKPPPDWPQNGVIMAHKAEFQFSPDTPLVLKDLSFHIGAREKAIICVLY